MESLLNKFKIPKTNRHIGPRTAHENDWRTLCECITEKRPVRVVVVMRILLQPFTSFGCHDYTAGGLSTWTPRREQGEREGCWEAWPRVRLLASPPMHQLTGPGMKKKKKNKMCTALGPREPIWDFHIHPPTFVRGIVIHG